MKDERVRKHLQKRLTVRQLTKRMEEHAKSAKSHVAENTEQSQESANDYGSQKIEQAPENAAYTAARAYAITRKQAEYRKIYRPVRQNGDDAKNPASDSNGIRTNQLASNPNTQTVDNHNYNYVNQYRKKKSETKPSDFNNSRSKTRMPAERKRPTGNASTGQADYRSRPMRDRTSKPSSRVNGRRQSNEPLRAAAQKQAAVRQMEMGRRRTIAHASEQTAIHRARAAAESTGRYLKMMLRESQLVTSLLSAGGIVAMLVVVLIVSIGMIVGSSFGILFSVEDTGTGMTIRDAIREINLEYETKLLALRADEHDSIEMTGSRAVWKDVLSVYAVRETTDLDNPQEVVSVTDEKERILRDLFWEMNVIEAWVETVTKTVTEDHPDAHGRIVTEQHEVTEKVLNVDVRHKSAEEMAQKYHFNEDQNAQLTELLSPDYNDMWATALYCITAGDGEIVEVARSQLGNIGGQPYWSWYGFGSRVEWCACFVSWCANECRYIENGIVPKYAYCPTGADWFKDRGQWAERDITPEPGMIIFFDWARGGRQDGETDHTGIVEKVENGRVYTIEGNSGNACREKSYPIGWYEIYGYGILCL